MESTVHGPTHGEDTGHRQQTFGSLSDIPAMFGTVGQGYFVLHVG